MLQLPMLMKVSSAAIAAAITASITYGQYAVAAGPKGSGLLPPASVFVPGVIAGIVALALAATACVTSAFRRFDPSLHGLA